MIFKLFPIVAMLAMGAGAPAEKPAAASSPKDIKMMHDLARCVVNRQEGQVRRLLAMDYRTNAYRGATYRMAKSASGCASFLGSLRMSNVLMAGSLAEAMLAKNGGGVALSRRLAYDATAPAVEARDEGEYLGLCVARTMPEAVEALLRAAPESAEEKAGVATLAPKLAPCVQAGASARINRHGLRAILALASYRLTTLNSADAPRPAKG
ncbi:MAG TPA: hypothetical protein VIA98_02510 [Allosphingosinicella sp.]|jgi:hypothetical protein